MGLFHSIPALRKEMFMASDIHSEIAEDLKACVEFHGHLCPGLVYGYRVAKEAMRLLGIERAPDEEIVTVCENDSCAVDGLQRLLGTTAGKGNLIVKDYGKNAFTVFSRKTRKAYRFSRTTDYRYMGANPGEFDVLEKAVSEKTATPDQTKRQKRLKALDLATKPFEEIFETREVDYVEPLYAPLAPSRACASCGEMTMATKMEVLDGASVCIPCLEKTMEKA
jgi:formylmethanofuran dehydrogenase subunit E